MRNAQFVQWRLIEEPCQIKTTPLSKTLRSFFFLVASSWKVITNVHALV